MFNGGCFPTNAQASHMKPFKNYTLDQYLEVLSQKKPVPGGGSAAALTAALGAALLSMAANYSLGRDHPEGVDRKLKALLKKTETIRKRLCKLIDLDAQAYLKVVETRKASLVQRQQALKKAREVPGEVCRLCYQAVHLAPYLIEKGNRYLISDVEGGVEMLLAAFKAAKANVEINQ